MKIARVFPTKTRMSPTDHDAYFGDPDFLTPKYDEVHISCTFTWDIQRGKELAESWKEYADIVKIGGPALDDAGGDFTGMYTGLGITITSRGCPNNCSFCFVPKREGHIRELPVIPGNIIQDNNLTACTEGHLDKVFSMLKTQKAIVFQGGLEACRITDSFINRLRGIRLKELWLAYDQENADKPLKKAVDKLSHYFKRDKLRCYVLIGYKDDTIEKADIRLWKAWDYGTLPFAMRYRTPSLDWGNTYLYPDRKWNIFQREWTRPAIIKSKAKCRELGFL